MNSIVRYKNKSSLPAQLNAEVVEKGLLSCWRKLTPTQGEHANSWD